MDTYKLLCWLPGEIVFYASDANGTVGLLSSNGFMQTPEHYVDSAVLKWGFMDLRPLNLHGSKDHLTDLANHLASIV